jgi:hypothetical protein
MKELAMTSKKASSATEAGATLGQRFQHLAAEWKLQRGPYSSSAKLAEHPAYQEIIALGSEAIPLLLAELERSPDHWFRALHALTGASPVPPESCGDVAKMAQAWLKWGRDQGYQW